MRTYALVAVSIAAALLAAATLWQVVGTPSYANYPPREGPIVAFGDSLVYGIGSTEGHDMVSVLSQDINEPIVNLGVPGNTTAQALERLDEALAYKPRIAIVLLGGNDYLQRVPPAETFRNLRAIIARLQEEGALVVLLGIRGGILSDNYRDDFDRLARETRSVYVSDVLNRLVGNSLYMFDQVHPNDDGYAIIAGRVFQALRPVLR